MNGEGYRNVFVQYIENVRVDQACVGAVPTGEGRDPLLVSFEKHLLENLKQLDVPKDDLGVYWFNVNRVAYLVENSVTHDQQGTTRKKIKDKTSPNSTINMKCPKSGSSELPN